MKNLKILIIGIFAFLTIQSFGQGWEMSYPAPIDTFVTSYVTADKMPNSDIAIYNKGYSQVLKINSVGTPTWSPIQSIGSIFSNFSKNNIIAAPDGNFILADNYSYYSGTPNTLFSELHIAKLNPNFDTIWTKKHSQLFPNNATYIINDVKQLSDNNILIVAYDNWGNDIKLIKINYNNGNILWSQSLTANGTNVYRYIGKEIIENPDGTLMLFHQKYASNNSDFRLSKLSSIGNVLWTQSYTQSNYSYEYIERTLDKTLDGGYVFGLVASLSASSTLGEVIVKTDGSGNEVWRTAINLNLINDLLVTTNNDILVVGQSTSYDSAGIVKLDMNGVVQFEKNYSDVQQSWGSSDFQKIIDCGNNNYIAIGYEYDNNLRSIFVVKFDSLGNTFTNFIQGNVYHDQNSNCSFDSGENSLGIPVMIQVVQGTDTIFNITDNTGHYNIGVLPGTYQVMALLNSNYWGNCPASSIVVNPNDTITQDLGLQPLTTCSDLTVNITTPALVRCFSNTYYVNYSNIGTQNETNVFVEIEFDPFLIVNSASIPYTQNGNIYIFQIGNLNMFQSGQFTVDVTVDCNAQLGQPHCVDAMIFPNQICLPSGNNYQGATIIADAFCSPNDSVTFKLENIGTGNMTQARNYWVIEDQILPLQGTYQLMAGQDTTFTLPANGYTYQIQADQEITHPLGNNVPSAVTFGCSSDTTITINNLINQFNLDDYLNFVDVDCQVNVGSYDPNDKQGFPMGYGTTHLIEKEAEIEYLLRFQNTGTAPAVNIEIRDTIDITHLDLSTLQLQSSSHPYILEIEDGNTLVFKFNNIMLPDSNTNEAASHGFVRFRIGQKTNNAIGTVIENSAAIYFDFNAPIITNTTFHTIGQNFVPNATPSCQVSFVVNQVSNPNITTQLIANPTGNAPFTFDWDFGNGQTLQTNNSMITYNFNPNDSLYICLTVTDANGCIATTCQYYTVPDVNTCVADFGYNGQNGIVNFVDYSTGSNFFVYNWNFGDGSTSSDVNPTHIYTTSGTYQVCLMVSNLLGCSDTYCQTINIVLPTINACLADFNYQMIGANTVQFNNQSSGGTNPHSFNWDFGNGVTGTAINPQYTYTSAGQYLVTMTMTDSSGCTSTAFDTVNIATNTMEIQAIENVKISPNPVIDLMQVQLNLTQSTSVKISIVTLTGQVVSTHNEQLHNGSHRLFVPTNNLPKGIYLLQINTENSVTTKRFMKQ